jgi:hypothetical protein
MSEITYSSGAGGKAPVYAVGVTPAKLLTGTFSFDTSYPTGGEAFDITGKFKSLMGVIFEPKAGYSFEYDYTNKKVKAYQNIKRYSATVDPGEVAAGACLDVDVTVAGVLSTDSVLAFPPVTLEAGIVVQAVVAKAADTITIRLYNPTAAPIDPASKSWVVVAASVLPVEAPATTNMSAVTGVRWFAWGI